MLQSSIVLNFRALRQRTPAIQPIVYRCHELIEFAADRSCNYTSELALVNQLVASEWQSAREHGERAVVTARVKLSCPFLSRFSGHLIDFILMDRSDPLPSNITRLYFRVELLTSMKPMCYVLLCASYILLYMNCPCFVNRCAPLALPSFLNLSLFVQFSLFVKFSIFVLFYFLRNYILIVTLSYTHYSTIYPTLPLLYMGDYPIGPTPVSVHLCLQ